MGDKCDFHDDCFKRLYEKVEAMDDKLDRLIGDIHGRLHEGDVRFVQLEMRLAQCEQALAGRTDLKHKFVNVAFDVLKLGIIAVLGAAWWALMNGYGK